MKKFWNPVFLIIALIIVTISFSFSVSANSAKLSKNPLSSPESYIEYLKNYNREEAKYLGIEEEHVNEAILGAKEALDDFLSLSSKEQQLYLQYMKDPQNLIEKTLNGNDPNLQLVQEEITYDYPPISPMANNRTVNHTGSLKLLGITWTKYNIEGKYEYNSTRVTKKLYNNAWVSWNINPTVTNSKISDVGYVTNGIYEGLGRWQYKIGVIGTGWGATIGTVEIEVYGDRNGKYDWSFRTKPGG